MKKGKQKPKDGPRQQSVPAFDPEDIALIERAMKIEAMPSQGQWVKHAAILWARRVVALDAGLLGKIEVTIQDRSE